MCWYGSGFDKKGADGKPRTRPFDGHYKWIYLTRSYWPSKLAVGSLCDAVYAGTYDLRKDPNAPPMYLKRKKKRDERRKKREQEKNKVPVTEQSDKGYGSEALFLAKRLLASPSASVNLQYLDPNDRLGQSYWLHVMLSMLCRKTNLLFKNFYCLLIFFWKFNKL